MHLPAFFTSSRQASLTFDLPTAKGVLFILYDTLASGTLSALCISDSPQGAMGLMTSTLSYLLKQAQALTVASRANAVSGSVVPGIGRAASSLAHDIQGGIGGYNSNTTGNNNNTNGSNGSGAASPEMNVEGLWASCYAIASAQQQQTTMVNDMMRSSAL